VGFEQWYGQHLLPSLKIPNVLIMDNSPIHIKNVIRELVEPGDYQLLFLPKYSPDLNDIEPDFSALKRAIMYSHINTSRFGNYSQLLCQIVYHFYFKMIHYLF
jgi:transposase